ncbi:MAG TPA: hypothetical protein ENJ00_06285, partial [Phycisphaerales bacterium]|nr:hypothetical protein [Phycisphaerales bacterium]
MLMRARSERATRCVSRVGRSCPAIGPRARGQSGAGLSSGHSCFLHSNGSGSPGGCGPEFFPRSCVMADTPMMMDRRGVLGIAGGAMALGMPGLSRPPRIILPTPRRRAHNIIFMVPDGMSVGTFTMADMMREVQGLGPSHWRRLWSRPDARRAMCTTYPADGWVTDSAAAASAWGIGRKVDNGAINFTPDGKAPEPIGR